MRAGRPTVAVLAFSSLERDARVQRHARALGRDHDVVLVGYANAATHRLAGAVVRAVAPPRRATLARRLGRAMLLAVGRAAPRRLYPQLFWDYELHRDALHVLRDIEPDVLLANDWPALPVAHRSAFERGVPFALDLHEHVTEQHAERAGWRWFRRPMAAYLLRTLGPAANQAFTVNDALADSYAALLGRRPMVILNAPDRVPLPEPRACDRDRVAMVHHGIAARSRRLECMIEAVALAGPRYHLDLMLVPTDDAYVRFLEQLAARMAPDRVRVVPPVAPTDIVTSIAGYDLGVFVLPPSNWQHLHCLPNKLFDFVVAGLGVVIGPSPEMARFVRRHACGVVAGGFEPMDVAAVLGALTAEEIDRMKDSARRASRDVNGQVEAEKLRAAFAAMMDAVPGVT